MNKLIFSIAIYCIAYSTFAQVSIDKPVGIGVTSPLDRLHVEGTDANLSLRLKNTGAGGATYRLASTNNSSGAGGSKFAIIDDASGNYRMVIDASGLVGVGTTTPTAVLNVRGNGTSSYRGIQVQNTFTDGTSKGAMALIGARYTNANVPFSAIGIWDNNLNRTLYFGGGQWGLTDATMLTFWTAAAYDETIDAAVERMRITGSGDVGIGTSTPATKLDVNGGFSTRSTSVSLTSDNQVITVGNSSYLRVTSDNTTATNRTFYLAAGQPGQQLVLELQQNSPNPAAQGKAELLADNTIAGAVVCRLSANATFSNPNSTLSLIYNGTNWIETSRSLTSTFSANKQVLSYTGSNQTFVVPTGVTQIFVKMWGAGGGAPQNWTGSGGSGAYVSGFLNVTPGQSLTVIVGGLGTTAGGFGGGGNSGGSISGGGGGRSAIRNGATELVTAGGGGGGAYNDPLGGSCFGGGGGATTGLSGGVDASHGAVAAQGGTTSAGGAPGTFAPQSAIGTAGSQFQGGTGSTVNWMGGGGGGGYYGGGGGAGYWAGGGGGGSSFTANLTSAVNLAGNTNSGFLNPAAPNNTDSDYVTGVGEGSKFSSQGGGNGLVVIYW